MRRLILGTAGHIDHGKTRLVRALTGVDTDRLAEEKRRGITIDLGFAALPLGDDVEAGVVDVPGHEGFIRNMLAGATGMDLVLLTVAGDEGVMPQTREHLAIVELLGVRRGVVAVTKSDLVEPAWLELVREELRDTLAPGPFSEWPVVAVSAATGEGLDALVEALRETAGGVPARRSDDLFRLPVDRVFTVHGTGTVVTGTVWHGSLAADGSVLILPEGREARVRGLQVHGREAERAAAGQRAALALAGVDRGDLRRGSVLVGGAGWSAQRMLTARVRVLEDSVWTLRHRQRVRFHLGTSEVMARLALLEGPEILPGETAWAQLRLEAAVVARAGDRFVLRSYSPMSTIGGGVVAEAAPLKRRRLGPGQRRALAELLSADPERIVRSLLRLAGWRGVVPDRIPVEAGLRPGEVDGVLDAAGCVRAGGRAFAADVAAMGEEVLIAAVERLHAEEPLRAGVGREELRPELPGWADPGLADALMDRLVARGELEAVAGALRRRGFSRRLTPGQEAVRLRLRDVFGAAALEPPALGDLPGDLAKRPDLWPLVRLMEEDGELVCVAPPDGYADAAAVGAAVRRVRSALAGKEELTPTDFKEVLGLSRKHLIPLLEHFDRLGVTRRRGDRRVLVPEEAPEQGILEVGLDGRA